MTNNIKSQANFIQNILYVLNETYKLTQPPTSEDIRSAYSAGVLVGLFSIKSLMTGKPVNGLITSICDETTLKELVEELGLSEEFKELDK